MRYVFHDSTAGRPTAPTNEDDKSRFTMAVNVNAAGDATPSLYIVGVAAKNRYDMSRCTTVQSVVGKLNAADHRCVRKIPKIHLMLTFLFLLRQATEVAGAAASAAAAATASAVVAEAAAAQAVSSALATAGLLQEAAQRARGAATAAAVEAAVAGA